MATLIKSVKRAGKTVQSSRSRSSPSQNFEYLNMEAFKGILSYLNYLYAKGEMTDKTYKVLVSQVIYTFVENTISLKVEKIFDDIDLTIREASEVLLMDILAQKDSLKRVG